MGRDYPLAIVAPYPGHDRYLDGWMSRIKTIDTVMSDFRRVYIDFQEGFPGDVEPLVSHPQDLVTVYRVNPNSPLHGELVRRILDCSSFVYIHTLHQCPYVLPYFDPDRMLVDIHGIVPEEEMMMGDKDRSQYFGEIERKVMASVKHAAVVTRSMARHYNEKYAQAAVVDFVYLPVFDYSVFHRSRALAPQILEKRRRLPRDRVIYAGGAQIWQCVDLMLECIARGIGAYDFDIFSHDIHEFSERLKRRGLPEDIFKGYVDKDRLGQVYSLSAFGFVLREAHVVNKVASPTKICDYCSSCVIPIVKFPEIGDFQEMGYGYVDCDDFMDGFVPDPDTQAWMIEQNLDCMERMYGDFRKGVAWVRGLIESKGGLSAQTLSGYSHVAVDREIDGKRRPLPRRAGLADSGEQPDRAGNVVDLYMRLKRRISATASTALSRLSPARVRRMFGIMALVLNGALKRKSTVFLAPYPDVENERDGFARRVAAIDSLFAERNKLYTTLSWTRKGKPFYRKVDNNTTVLALSAYNPIEILFFLLLSLLAGDIYIHSIYWLDGVTRRTLLYLPIVRKTLDLHGAVPEEARILFARDSSRYERIEELAVRHCDRLVAVSKAMRKHMLRKYPFLSEGRFIILPQCGEDAAAFSTEHDARDETYRQGRIEVVYAGGLQPWQQIESMFDVIAEMPDRARWLIYTPEPERARRLIAGRVKDLRCVTVDSAAPEEMPAIYSRCHFGFVLREDNVVNNVSCPTKLMEYIRLGIIPVLNSPHIGDFEDMSLRYISLEDFRAGRLPSPDERIGMVGWNRALYEKMIGLAEQGKEALRCE